MENYKQKYEDALETARKINSGEGVAAPKDWSILEVIFPELRKSKDELMREELIHFLETCRDPRLQEEWVDWLEKQESKSSWSEEDENTFVSLCAELPFMVYDCYLEDVTKYIFWLETLKQRLDGTK